MGSETFVERVSDGLVSLGHDVTILTAGYPGAAADESRSGRTYRRRGGRYTVYARAATHLVRHGAAYDVVLDVQNGVPFWTPLWTRTPVVDVVHHVHREQWPEVFGPVRARFGWWLESRVAPRVYRRIDYVTVSDATRQELVTLGVPAASGSAWSTAATTCPSRPSAPAAPRTPDPSMVVLGRLVPHKRVELAIDGVGPVPTGPPRAAAHGGRARLLGAGAAGPRRGAGRRPTPWTSRASSTSATKHRLLARAWLRCCRRSRRAGGWWCVEAGVHRDADRGLPHAPAARRSRSSTVSPGLLADDDEEFLAGVGPAARRRRPARELGRGRARPRLAVQLGGHGGRRGGRARRGGTAEAPRPGASRTS